MESNATASAGTAVSGLMQQLKSGEISKMQLFQQIARIQASTVTPAVFSATSAPGSALNGALSSVSYGRGASTVPFYDTATPAGMSAMNFTTRSPHPSTAANADAFATSSIHCQPSSTAPPPIPSARPVPSEHLSGGVSHERAQRLSVQEWMASKTRGSSSVATATALPASVEPPPPASVSNLNQPSTEMHQPQSSEDPPGGFIPGMFSLLQQPSAGNGLNSFANTSQQPRQRELVQPHSHNQTIKHEREIEYVYSPAWPYPDPGTDEMVEDSRHEDECMTRPSRVHEYIEYDDDPFRDSHDNLPSPSQHKANKGKPKTSTATNGDAAKFHTRVTRWKSQKDAIREQLKQQLLQSELNECTFAPRVNPKSTEVIAKRRGRQRSIGDALDGGGVSSSVSERLYQEADNHKAREELAARVRAEEEAELERECTFRPKTNRGHPLSDKVKPKYMDIPKKDTPTITPAAMEAAARELRECTFNPKVNPVNEEMASAQLYLKQDIFERLSRPCNAGSPRDRRYSGGSQNAEFESAFDEDSDADADELIAMGIMAPRSRRTQDDMYVRNRRRRTLVINSIPKSEQRRPRSAGGVNTEEEKAERSRKFDAFLERQQFHEEARKKKIEMTKNQLLQPHKPSINPNSAMMMENGRKGDFLERVTSSAIRREHDTVRKNTVLVSDPNCTFKPTINPHSTKRRGRSVTELSRGDLLRRETTQRLMKLKMEQDEMAALTFRPQLNRISQRGEGRLKILTSPDTYLHRIQQQSQAHTIKQRRAIQEKEMDEFAECTFKPRTIEAPAYVQRIARSVTLTKALKKQQEAASRANQKPEWK